MQQRVDGACFCCSLKRIEEARLWLAKAIAGAGTKSSCGRRTTPSRSRYSGRGATSSAMSTLLRSSGKNDLRKALDAATRRS